MPWYLGNSRILAGGWENIIAPLLVWSLIWKGLAFWYAARREEKVWYIVLLLVNTAGILEIIYLAFVAKIFTQSKSSRKKHR